MAKVKAPRQRPGIVSTTAHVVNAAGGLARKYMRFIKKRNNERNKQRDKQNSPIPTKKGKNKQKEIVRQIGNHDVVKTFNKITYKPTKAAKMYKKLTNMSTYDATTSFGYLSGEGVQAVNTLTGVCEQGELKLIFQKLTQLYLQTAGAQYQSITTAGYADMRMMLQKCQHELRIVNQGPTTAEVDVYICMSKNTTASSVDPGVSWSSGLTNEKGSGSPAQSNPWATPTQVKQFNIDWKVVKKLKLSLESGRELTHTFMFTPNRILDTEYINTYFAIKGITYRYLFVQRGTLGDNSDATVAAIGGISLTPTKIIGNIRRVYKASLLSPYATTVTQTGTYATSDGHLYQMNPELAQVVDAITNVAVAASTSNIA